MVEIIDYTPILQAEFASITKSWVEEFFTLEDFDREQTGDPQKHILEKGGAILFAKLGGEVVGTVGLIESSPGVFEMIKMGVKLSSRGLGIGRALGLAILDKARELGGHRMILFSSSKLGAALTLYRSLGFKSVPVGCSAYGRCDVRMEIDL